MLPDRSITCPTTAATDVAGHVQVEVSHPGGRGDLAVLRPVPTTSKPALGERDRAAALPIPEDAPVTSAARRFVVIMGSCLIGLRSIDLRS